MIVITRREIMLRAPYRTTWRRGGVAAWRRGGEAACWRGLRVRVPRGPQPALLQRMQSVTEAQSTVGRMIRKRDANSLLTNGSLFLLVLYHYYYPTPTPG